jgi:hypothetical protein
VEARLLFTVLNVKKRGIIADVKYVLAKIYIVLAYNSPKNVYLYAYFVYPAYYPLPAVLNSHRLLFPFYLVFKL